jgi:glutamate-1-semialdehyde 2,1-aminomutase
MTTTSQPAGTSRAGATSRRLHEEARRHIPGGTSRVHYYYEPHPIYARSGRGCRLVDADGVERLDFLNNMTSLIHGHAHPAIVAAIVDQVQRGTAWSEPGEEELRLARHLVERVASLEQIRFANSGTEAVMQAIKLAREFTGRSRIAKFEGIYHGYYDYVQVSVRTTPANWGPVEAPASIPNSGGLSASVPGEVLTVPFNNPDVLEQLLDRHGSSLAGFILDPLSSMAGSPIPAPGFLDLLSELTRRHGIILIYDEVVSFRVEHGGAQARFGGRPDLTAFGKIIGGGLPVGAVGGRADIMSLLDPSRGAPRVPSGGTFSANPLTMAAGLAALERFDPAEVARLNALGERLRQRANEVFDAAGEAARMGGAGSLLRIVLSREPIRDYRDSVRTAQPASRMAALHRHLLDEGVIIAKLGMGCLSTPMGDAEVDAFILALERAVARLER